MKTYLIPAGLLLASNTFMTIAWYGHLKFEKTALWIVVLVSWGIALLEYCFQVPANRYGNQHGLVGRSIEDHAGGHHARRLRHLRAAVPRRKTRLELSRGVWIKSSSRCFLSFVSRRRNRIGKRIGGKWIAFFKPRLMPIRINFGLLAGGVEFIDLLGCQIPTDRAKVLF